MVRKKTESKSSWTLFFSTPFPPHVWDSVFFRAPKLASALDYPSANSQHQGSGFSFRGAKGSLYWFCPIQIPPKCWGSSNLLHTFSCREAIIQHTAIPSLDAIGKLMLCEKSSCSQGHSPMAGSTRLWVQDHYLILDTRISLHLLRPV